MCSHPAWSPLCLGPDYLKGMDSPQTRDSQPHKTENCGLEHYFPSCRCCTKPLETLAICQEPVTGKVKEAVFKALPDTYYSFSSVSLEDTRAFSRRVPTLHGHLRPTSEIVDTAIHTLVVWRLGSSPELPRSLCLVE